MSETTNPADVRCNEIKELGCGVEPRDCKGLQRVLQTCRVRRCCRSLERLDGPREGVQRRNRYCTPSLRNR
jgi:hypothetical protein